MASYKLLFKRSAEKELRKIPSSYLSKILKKIGELTENPRPPGVQMLKGEDRYFRFRHGDYRVIYEVDDPKLEVTIIKIGHRREVYDSL